MITRSDVPAETVAASTVAVMADPITDLAAAGVAIWLDDLSRARLATGGLADLVRDSHVVGVTTNPTIFEKAMSHSDSYDRQISDLALRGVEVEEAARMITTFDIRWACDVLRSVYDASDGVDGRVSIEVDPPFAHEPSGRSRKPANCGGWWTDPTCCERSSGLTAPFWGNRN